MAEHIILLNFTEQGIRNVKDAPKRLDAARKLGSGLGVEIKDAYLTMGTYDLVIHAQSSDDKALAKFLLAVGSLGNARTTTLRAFGEKEYREIVAQLP